MSRPDLDIEYKGARVRADMDPIEWVILFFIILVVLWYVMQ